MASLQMLHFPELLGRLVSTSLFYFKSSWEDVRAAAPMLTGEQRPSVPFYLRWTPPPPDPDPASAHRVPSAARGGRAPATGGPGAAHSR